MCILSRFQTFETLASMQQTHNSWTRMLEFKEILAVRPGSQ